MPRGGYARPGDPPLGGNNVGSAVLIGGVVGGASSPFVKIMGAGIVKAGGGGNAAAIAAGSVKTIAEVAGGGAVVAAVVVDAVAKEAKSKG